MIDSAHHPREVTTIAMTLYSQLRILHAFEHKDPQMGIILKQTAITFIPLVNPDGFAFISKHYLETGEFLLIRKNMHLYD